MPVFEGGKALIVGVAAYDDKGLTIASKITVKEARSVAEVLKNPDVGAYAKDQVTLLEDPTRKELLDGLDALAKETKAKPARTVFLNFIGHGFMGDDGTYYFTTKDTILANKYQVKSGTGVSEKEILEQLRKIKSDKLLFVINACFSGNLQPESLGGPIEALGVPPTTPMAAEILATGEGRALISACRDTQQSYFSSANPSTFFGEALLKGLNGVGVPDADGYVGLFELYQRIYQGVSKAVNVNVIRQEPVLTLVQGVGPFPVSLYQGAKSGTLGPPDTAKLQQRPTLGAVEELPRSVIIQINAGRDSVQVHGDQYNSTFKVIEISGGTVGPVTVGTAVGGNLTNININTGAAAASKASDRDELITTIDKLGGEVNALSDLTKYARQDVTDALAKAKAATADGAKARAIEKLDEAEKALLKAEGGGEASRKVSAAIAAAKQRASALAFPAN